RSVPVAVDGPQMAAGKGLAALPRFVPVDQPFQASSGAKEIVAEQEKEPPLKFPVAGGQAMVKLPRPGWYRLVGGGETVAIFAYGGKDHPHAAVPWLEKPKREDDRPNGPRWVNLTDYALEEEGRGPSRWDHPDRHLLALFDRQHGIVGDKLR